MHCWRLHRAPARHTCSSACHAEPAKKPIEKISPDERWYIPLSSSVPVCSRTEVTTTHASGTPDACETHARSVEEPIASLVLMISPVIPCSLASSLVLSLAICCSVSHFLGPCFAPDRRGLATTGHRTALGPPGYSLYPRISEQEKRLDNPYSVELIRDSPSAELQAVTMIPWH
jgi:hypothetical protein